MSPFKTLFLLSQLNLDGRRYSLQATCSFSLCFSRYDKVSVLEPLSTLRSSPCAIAPDSSAGQSRSKAPVDSLRLAPLGLNWLAFGANRQAGNADRCLRFASSSPHQTLPSLTRGQRAQDERSRSMARLRFAFSQLLELFQGQSSKSEVIRLYRKCFGEPQWYR